MLNFTCYLLFKVSNAVPDYNTMYFPGARESVIKAVSFKNRNRYLNLLLEYVSVELARKSTFRSSLYILWEITFASSGSK